MICTVQEFDEVADDLKFTEAHETFTNFRKCLRDVARDDWDTTKVGQAITVAGFKVMMYAWKLMILPEDIYEVQKNYIETVKKPYTMTVRDFVKRLHQMASYLPEFPRPMAATALSETDLKNIIFRGMPNAWQENFVQANMHISSITLVQMTDYLASVIADTRREKNTQGRGSSGRNSHNGRGHNPGRGRGYQGRSYQGRGHSLSNKCSSSWTPSNNSHNEAKTNPCHYHGNAHTWLKCYGNPDGPNYCPGFTPRPHGATGRGRGVFCVVVEMEVIRMMPTRTMMPLIMQALIIMHRVQHQWLQTIPMPLDGVLVISLLIMQLPTIIGLIPSGYLNDARSARSSLLR
eukprot:scaffold2113_cov63-Attheya_sp.AAC.3